MGDERERRREWIKVKNWYAHLSPLYLSLGERFDKVSSRAIKTIKLYYVDLFHVKKGRKYTWIINHQTHTDMGKVSTFLTHKELWYLKIGAFTLNGTLSGCNKCRQRSTDRTHHWSQSHNSHFLGKEWNHELTYLQKFCEQSFASVVI